MPFQAISDVLAHAEMRKKGEILWNVTDGPLTGGDEDSLCDIRQRGAVQLDQALLGSPQSRHQFQNGGFSGTLWPEEPGDLPVEREIQLQCHLAQPENDVLEDKTHAAGALRLKSHSLVQTAAKAKITETASKRNASLSCPS